MSISLVQLQALENLHANARNSITQYYSINYISIYAFLKKIKIKTAKNGPPTVAGYSIYVLL